MITPVIHLDYLHFLKDEGKPAADLFEHMEGLRLAVKEAVGYAYDNSNIKVTDIFGRPSLRLEFERESLHIWNAVDGGLIGTFSKIPKIHHMSKRVEQGYGFCTTCCQWRLRQDLRSYSFNEKVCRTCYDNDRHLPVKASEE